LAKVAVQYSADTFVVNQTLVLHINICVKNRHLRQAAKNKYGVVGIDIRYVVLGVGYWYWYLAEMPA